jgi:hypothetical protein
VGQDESRGPGMPITCLAPLAEAGSSYIFPQYSVRGHIPSLPMAVLQIQTRDTGTCSLTDPLVIVLTTKVSLEVIALNMFETIKHDFSPPLDCIHAMDVLLRLMKVTRKYGHSDGRRNEYKCSNAYF